MKKTLLPLFAMAAMLFATSCSQEENFAPVADGSDANVSFSVQLPQEIATRADYSDGLTAQTLMVAFYDAADASKTPLLQDELSFNGGLTTTVNVNLATGKTYDIIFWAQSPNNETYSINWKAQTMTVDYEAMKANDENNDAFYWFENDLKVNSAINKEIKLYRPFAQINLGTSDYEDAALAGLTVNRSAMKAVELPSVLNFANGAVSENVIVEVEANTIPGATAEVKAEAFPVTGYEYLEMNYVLVGKDKATVNCEFFIYEDGATTYLDPTIVVSNVPVQRNYRTNIYGALLTDPANFNVTIVPDYETPDYEVNVWDGVTVTEFTAEELAAPEIKLESAADLAGFINAVNVNVNGDGRNKFANQTIVLTADIDMSGYEIEPMGSFNDNIRFAGTFDGNGHTISNFKAVNNTTKDNATAGLFGAINEFAVIKNLTVDGAEVHSTKYAGALCAYAGATDNGEGANIINCHVKNSKVTSTSNACGGIGGFISRVALIENCTVTNTEIVTTQRGGGLIGRVQSNPTVKDCAVNNITLTPYGSAAMTKSNLFIGDGAVKLEGTNTVDGVAL